MDQMRLLPQATDRKVKLLMQLFQVLAHQVAHLHVLAVIPAAFVPGVEIWSVSRQSLQPDLAACAGHELCYRRSAVDRRAVPDHQQPLARHTQQVLQELDALHRVERLLPRQREDLPRRRQPAQNGQVVARLLLAEDGCLSLGTISPDQPRQQVEPRFVLENQHAALTLGAPEQFRPDPATPAADGFLVPLDGSPNRHWGRPVQFLEQLADVAFVVAAAQLLLDHQGDARTGPHLASKPVGLRAMPEKLWNQTLLSGRELGRTPRTGLRAQSLRSAVTGTGEPTADAHGGDAERFGDVVPRPALLFQVQRSEPPPLKAGSRKEIMVLHTPILGGEESNLLCAAVSSAAVIYVCFPDPVDRLFSAQLAWAGLLDAEESGLIRAASAMLRLAEIQKRWPNQSATLLEEMTRAEAAGRDSVDVLFDDKVLEANGLVIEDVVSAVVEHLTDAEVKAAVAEALAAADLTGHLRSLRRDGEVRPYYVQRDTKG